MDADAINLINKEQILNEALIWVEANKSSIPDSVYQAMTMLVAFKAELDRCKQRASKLLTSFRTILGIIPKAERNPKPTTSSPPEILSTKTDAEKLAAIKARRAKLLIEIRRYEDRLGKGRGTRQKVKRKKGQTAPIPTNEPAHQKPGETVFSGNLAKPVEEANKLVINRFD